MTEGSVPRRTNAVPIAEELDDNDTTPDAAPPPAYGDSLGQLQLSQAGFGADAEITCKLLHEPNTSWEHGH